eukprot:GHUV01036189.1.p1 GENE.GHUV01036189.1~~GHUV01036189.1.p1  ORF type:complete len:177 (-),score=35.71 GHUV01036189.1:47-577(-)
MHIVVTTIDALWHVDHKLAQTASCGIRAIQTNLSLFTALCNFHSLWMFMCRRVTCLQCGANTCRHEMQQQLADLNPHMADRVRQITTAAAAAGQGPGISNRSAYERALRVGTAADGRKVQAGEQAEKVETPNLIPCYTGIGIVTAVHHNPEAWMLCCDGLMLCGFGGCVSSRSLGV